MFLNAVFHWVNDKKEALDNIYYVLKPGGRLGICTRDKDHSFMTQVITTEVLQRAGIIDDDIRNLPEVALKQVKVEIMEGLERKRALKEIENIYYLLFSIAEKDYSLSLSITFLYILA